MPLNPLSHELGGFGARHGFSNRLTSTGIVALANTIAAGRFVARSFRAGRLVVEIPDAEARYLLQPEVSTIIAQLNEQLGAARVTSIQFRLVGPIV